MVAGKPAANVAEAVHKFFAVKFDHKIALKRAYDDWYFKQLFYDKKMRSLMRLQQLDPKTTLELGEDVAVSKMFMRFGGQIRNHRGDWLTSKKDLPTVFDKHFKVTAINASNCRLVTESMDSLVYLNFLESVDISNNPSLDDFACDILARQYRKSKTLKAINVSHNPAISVYGLEILLRIPSLSRITAAGTLASELKDIDLFVMAAQDERQCNVYVHPGDKQYNSPELEELRGVRLTREQEEILRSQNKIEQ